MPEFPPGSIPTPGNETGVPTLATRPTAPPSEHTQGGVPAAGGAGGAGPMRGMLSEITEAIDDLRPEEQTILATAITPQVAMVLSKILGSEFGELLLRALNNGPDFSRPPQASPGGTDAAALVAGGPQPAPRGPSIPTGAPGASPYPRTPMGSPGALANLKF